MSHTHRPVVSVVVPTHNRPRLTQRAVGSVLSQTFTDLEVLVIDDASSDNTVDELNRIRDDRLRVIPLRVNQGAGRARNVGIQESRGDYVSFLDSDDEWLPCYLECVLDAFDAGNDNPQVVRSDALLLWSDRGIVRTAAAGDIREKVLLCQESPVFSTITVRSSALVDGPRFSETLWFPDDRAFMLELARGARFGRVGEPLVIIHRQHGEHMNQLPARVAIRADFLSRYRNELSNHPKEHERLLVSQGRMLWRSGDRRASLNSYLDSLRVSGYPVRGLLRVASAIIGSIGRDILLALPARRRSYRVRSTR